MPTHRSVVSAALTAAGAFAASLSAGPAAGAVLPPPPRDHLTITVADSGDPAYDGTYELYCHPVGGDHPEADDACETLDDATVWGQGPFDPVPRDAHCTMQYGGPATAHVTGTWAGRPVDADFSRANGCEIARWDRLVPMLPGTGH